MRIFPYSSLQFYTYEYLKKSNLINFKNEYYQKLSFGFISAISAITFTHPLDVIRHRQMYYNTKDLKTTVSQLYNERGLLTFIKGYNSNFISSVPFITINLTFYDILKNKLNSNNPNYYFYFPLISGLSGTISQSICYPLDTIRRRMQIKENTKIINTFNKIIANEGVYSLYKGFFPNLLKVIPNNVIRFGVFEFLKLKLIDENFK